MSFSLFKFWELVKQNFSKRGFILPISLAFAYNGAIDRLDDSLKKMQLAYLAPSLGGTETLITRPRTTTHASLSKEDCEKLGIIDDLVRVSVGLEDPHDLIADFQAALDR